MLRRASPAARSAASMAAGSCPKTRNALRLRALYHIDRRQGEPHPRGIARIHRTVEARRFRRRSLNKPLHVVGAADGAVERHDVSRRQRVGDRHEIAAYELYVLTVTAPVGLLARDGEMRRGGIDMDDVRDGTIEQLVVNRANAGTDVEQHRVPTVRRLERDPERLDEEPRRLVRSAALEVAQRLLRRVRTELLLYSVALRTRWLRCAR
jgi:hypothetical protein